ncbi:unnamed protein product [Zymoseptoria tritici ST99CH_3D1]|nr:unnamed protein product [Zymoseptoria tritici ST99CH_3D1]
MHVLEGCACASGTRPLQTTKPVHQLPTSYFDHCTTTSNRISSSLRFQDFEVTRDHSSKTCAFDYIDHDQTFQRTIKMQLPTFLACLFFMGFVATASSWSITFYESKADCKGKGDRERYTSYVGSKYNYWTLAGTKDRDSGDCQQTRDGGHNFEDCNSGPLDTHKLYFTVGSGTHCRFSWTAGFFMPSDLRGTMPGDEGKCWTMTSAIGKTPEEFYFQCGEIDDPYWNTAGGGGSS